MKKSLLALATLTAFAGVASAQSTVTLFGVVDMSLQSSKVGSASAVKKLATDGIASSRLGFRGVEDLGGGMSAGFWLEAGMSNDVGQVGGNNGCSATSGYACPSTGASIMFNRRSTASLMGSFGEIRLGRDYDPSFWNYTVFDPFGTNGVAAHTNVLSTVGSGVPTLVRDNNTVGYFLPAMGGVYGQAMYAFAEGNTTGFKYTGFRLGYAAGPVNVAFANGSNAKTGSMTSNYTDRNLGASYNFGFMNLMGQTSKRTYGAANQKTWLAGATFPVGASTFKFSYAKSDGTSDSLDAKQLGLGYVYDLSKRTSLYATYNKTDAKINTSDVTSYEFGVKTSF